MLSNNYLYYEILKILIVICSEYFYAMRLVSVIGDSINTDYFYVLVIKDRDLLMMMIEVFSYFKEGLNLAYKHPFILRSNKCKQNDLDWTVGRV